MKEIFFRKIQNDILSIREIDEQDLDDLFEMFSDPEVVRYLSLEIIKNKDIANQFLHKIINDYRNHQIFYLGIELNSEHKMIGCIGLSRFDLTETTCQVIYALNQKYWYRGLMVQALQLFVDYLFDIEKKDCIIATHIDSNINSGRVMQKAGFEKDELYNRVMNIKGIERNLIGYSIKRKKE